MIDSAAMMFVIWINLIVIDNGDGFGDDDGIGDSVKY